MDYGQLVSAQTQYYVQQLIRKLGNEPCIQQEVIPEVEWKWKNPLQFLNHEDVKLDIWIWLERKKERVVFDVWKWVKKKGKSL